MTEVVTESRTMVADKACHTAEESFVLSIQGQGED